MRPPVLRCLLPLAAVIYLTSQVTVLAIDADTIQVNASGAAFVREKAAPLLLDGTPLAPQTVTPAASEAACALGCAAFQPWFCRGLTYQPSTTGTDGGTCLMYSSCADGTPQMQGEPTASDSVSYRRLHPNCAETCDCPAGFTLCAGLCLLLLDDWTQYTPAGSLCAARGAHLAVPRSQHELQCVRQLADDTGKTHVWLGVSDVQTEGEYRGLDGCGPLAVPDSWWSSDQPNGGASENYIASTPTGWFDSPSDNDKHPICQLNGCFKPQCL